MKKSGSGKIPKGQISKPAYAIAKKESDGAYGDGSQKGADTKVDKNAIDEEEIMGERGEGKKSESMQNNLNQMVNLLHVRLKHMEATAKARVQLSAEDLMANSTRTSSSATDIVTEYDEAIPKSLKDSKPSSTYHKDNLVSSDTVFIDPYHLVVKTKAPTETAKKLEMNLEESFGNVNIRELKSKKTKSSISQSEKSKKSEQLKNEAKRINRVKLEKLLQTNMESFLTRSVVDADLMFRPPDNLNEEVEWPVLTKWCAKDPRSAHHDNAEGEFLPELLLRYSIERMNLPSGRKLFMWLIRQPMVQSYFVSLFWLLKVKFFETEADTQSEAYLLRKMGVDYRHILALLSERAHAEHEKDFVFRYFPFLLTNGVYFGFYFICPGSRHMYTKGLKKTIYMQIVQILTGIQLCSASVKVAWQKVFPEDTHEEGDDNEGADTFPVQLALTGPKFDVPPPPVQPGAFTSTGPMMNMMRSASAPSTAGTMGFTETPNTPFSPAPTKTEDNTMGIAVGGGEGSPASLGGMHSVGSNRSHHSSKNGGDAVLLVNPPKGKGKGAYMSGGDDGEDILFDYRTEHVNIDVAATIGKITPLYETVDPIAQVRVPNHKGGMLGGFGISAARHTYDPKSDRLDFLDHHLRELADIKANNPDLLRSDGPGGLHPAFARQNTGLSSNMSEQDNVDMNNLTTQQFFDFDTTRQCMGKTYLKPILQKPDGIQAVIRQCNTENINAKGLSPQIQLLLSHVKSQPDSLGPREPFNRTLPVSWCPAGGSDTHRKTTLPTELVAEVAVKARHNEAHFKQHTIHFHKEKVKALKDHEKQLKKVISSGPTIISRYSLDLIRRQRAAKLGENKEAVGAVLEEVNMAEIRQQAYYDDAELEKFIQEL